MCLINVVAVLLPDQVQVMLCRRVQCDGAGPELVHAWEEKGDCFRDDECLGLGTGD